MNVAHRLSDRAARDGDRPAIVEGSAGQRALSFAGLEDKAARAADRLRAAGLRPGDPVLVLAPMSAELYVVLSALFRAGLVAMFLDPSAGREHIDACCAMLAPKAFIGAPRAHWLRFLSPALRRIPVRFSTGRSVLGALTLAADRPSPGPGSIEPCDADTPALIRFTSGTTGQPKAAVRTHGFLLEQQRVIEQSLRLVAGEVDLATLPIFVLANLAAGVTSIIPPADLRAPGAIRPAPVIRQIRTLKPQRMTASPAFLERLADCCSRTAETLESFRAIFTGGAPVFPHLLDRFQLMAPAAGIVAVYGSTEAEPIAQVSRDDISEADRQAMAGGRGLLAGKPDPAIQIRILPEPRSGRDNGFAAGRFESASLAPNVPGEIVVSGPHVQPGYLHGIGDRETKFKVKGVTWHLTGDAGCLDASGRLWLLGRNRARIRDDRGTLYPFPVECAAHHHPGIRRAALVAHRGERVLVLEPRNGLQPSEVQAALAWADLDRIRLVRHIPVDRRHNAKVDYAALQRML